MPNLTQSRVKTLTGTLTTDGAGAASVSLTTTGYAIRGIVLKSDDGSGTFLTGGTMKAQDNNGAGTIHATFTPDGAGNSNIKPVSANPATASGAMANVDCVSPLNIVVSGGGASKKAAYTVQLVFKR